MKTNSRYGWVKIAFLLLILAGLSGGVYYYTTQGSLSDVAQDQIQALRKNDIAKAYYLYTSRAYQDKNSLEAFRNWIKTQPALLQNKNADFYGQTIHGNTGSLAGNLTAKNGNSTSVIYHFIEDNRRWKIQNMEVMGTPRAEIEQEVAIAENETPLPPPAKPQEVQKPAPENNDKEAIAKVVQNQLDLLKNGKIEEAYNDFVSDEFKQATPLDEFKNFIKNYPEFQNYTKVTIGENSVDNGLNLQKITLTTEKGDSQVNYWVTKTGNQWKIWGINVVSSSTYPPVEPAEKAELIRVIDDQLKALRAADVSKAYYGFTSQEFDKATSFDDFKKYIDNYPIFKNQQSFDVIDAITEGNLKLVKVKLVSSQDSSEVDFRLIKEGNKWKVWGIQILTEPNQTPQNPKEVEEVIRDQLKAIREGDLSKAYYAFTSEQFQEAASNDQFKSYVNAHSDLTVHTIANIEKIDFKPNMAIALVHLATENKSGNTYEFRLAFENDKWKVLGIQVAPADTTPAPAKPKTDTKADTSQPFEFTKAIIGTEVNLQGIVNNPTTQIKDRSKEITVNLYINGGKKGDQVEVVLEHVESKSSIPPVDATLDKDGESVVNFIFTPPTQGWPVGHYTLHAKSPEGQEASFAFEVTEK